MESLSSFLSGFYGNSTIAPIVGGTSLGQLNLGTQFTGASLPEPSGPNNFGGSGKSFSQLSAGTGLAGILGLTGIAAADATGNKDVGDAIAAGGVNSITINGGSGNIFARIAIIVLGFIFVAVGLSMFKNPVEAVAAVALPP